MTNRSLLTIIFIFLLILSGCSLNNSTDENDLLPKQSVQTNQPPVLKEFRFSSNNISVCDTLSLSCFAEDPEKESLTYEWHSYKLDDNSDSDNHVVLKTKYVGRFIEYAPDSVIWIPGILKGKYLVLLKVIDTAGYEIVKDILINVSHSLCENREMYFEITNFGSLSVEEYSKVALTVPQIFILSYTNDDQYHGSVIFDSLGTQPILNFSKELGHQKSFYIDHTNYHPPDGIVIFRNIEISIDRMVGDWYISCSACDFGALPFVAQRK